MNGWAENINEAAEYIEMNITEELNVNDIAAKACVSAFHFQRIFSALCGFTVGEYIRSRRLSLAAEELSCGRIKVIDAAVKYGYDSPDSFAKAFAKFHGIPPSAAKEHGANLRLFAPIHIKLSLEGGNMLEYKIVEKSAFTVIGKRKRFSGDTSYEEIPKFWDEHYKNGGGKFIKGMFGICCDGNMKDFEYWIADSYQPWEQFPEDYSTKTIPAGTWAVFPCRGPMPKALQDVNTKIWSEWLPACKEYELAGNYNIEMYSPCGNLDDSYSEIWIPVKKKQ